MEGPKVVELLSDVSSELRCLRNRKKNETMSVWCSASDIVVGLVANVEQQQVVNVKIARNIATRSQGLDKYDRLQQNKAIF